MSPSAFLPASASCGSIWQTGQRAEPGDSRVIVEAFKPGTEPNGENSQVIMGIGVAGSGAGDAPTPAADSSGGLY